MFSYYINMNKINLNLTGPQMRALAGGRVVTIKPGNMKGSIPVYVGPVKHRKLTKAMNANKGYRLSLNEDEKKHIMTEGGALRDYLTKKRVRKVVDTALKVGKPVIKKIVREAVAPHVGDTAANVIADASTTLVDSGVNQIGKKTGAFGLKKKAKKTKVGGKVNFKKIGRDIKRGIAKAGEVYRKDIRPVVGPALKEVTKQAIKQGLPAMATALAVAQPEFAPLVPLAKIAGDKLADPATNAIGKTTGAFGIGFGMKKKEFKTETNHSNFLNNRHPAMRPLFHSPDFSIPRHGNATRSGDFGNQSLSYHRCVNLPEPGQCSSSCSNTRYGSGSLLLRTPGPAKRGTPLNPLLPPKDNSLRELYYYDKEIEGGSFRVAGGSFRM